MGQQQQLGQQRMPVAGLGRSADQRGDQRNQQLGGQLGDQRNRLGGRLGGRGSQRMGVQQRGGGPGLERQRRRRRG